MNKSEILEHLRSGVFARIGRSEVHGIGVIAIRGIPQGVDPFPGARQCSFVPLSEEDLRSLPEEIASYLRDYAVFSEGRFLAPDFGLNAMDVSWYMNHSRMPNIAVANAEALDFVTLREIKAGEKLTLDYGTFDDRREDYRR